MRTCSDFGHDAAVRLVVFDLVMNDIGKNLSRSRRNTANDRRSGLIAARLDPKDNKFGWRSGHGIRSMLMDVFRLRVGA